MTENIDDEVDWVSVGEAIALLLGPEATDEALKPIIDFRKERRLAEWWKPYALSSKLPARPLTPELIRQLEQEFRRGKTSQ